MIYAIGVVYGETAVNCSDWRAILSGDERFQKFAAFVDKMDALDVMTSRGNHTTPGATFTILAPVNEAMTSWQRKYEIQDDAQNDDAKRDAVNAIMSYHILVDGRYNTTMMANTFGFATWKYKSGLDDLPVLVQVSDTQKKYRQNRMQCLQSLCACLNGSIRFFLLCSCVDASIYIYIWPTQWCVLFLLVVFVFGPHDRQMEHSAENGDGDDSSVIVSGGASSSIVLDTGLTDTCAPGTEGARVSILALPDDVLMAFACAPTRRRMGRATRYSRGYERATVDIKACFESAQASGVLDAYAAPHLFDGAARWARQDP